MFTATRWGYDFKLLHLHTPNMKATLIPNYKAQCMQQSLNSVTAVLIGTLPY